MSEISVGIDAVSPMRDNRLLIMTDERRWDNWRILSICASEGRRLGERPLLRSVLTIARDQPHGLMASTFATLLRESREMFLPRISAIDFSQCASEGFSLRMKSPSSAIHAGSMAPASRSSIALRGGVKLRRLLPKAISLSGLKIQSVFIGRFENLYAKIISI